MNRLLKIFGTRAAGIVCFLFAIANRIVFISLYSIIAKDSSYQIAIAKNWLAGKGMGITKYYSADLQKPIFDTLHEFPPGFSYAIAPFLKLFKNDYDAILAFDMIIMVLLICSVRFLGKQMGLSAALNNLLTLIVGSSQYAFIMQGWSTDSTSLMLVLFSLGLLIKIISKKQALNWPKMFIISILFFLPSFFRYMYIPVSLLFPIIIVGFGIYFTSSLLRSTGLKLAAVTYSLVLFWLFSSYLTNGKAVYLYDTERGFFLHHLIHWYPYIPASFINIDFLAQLIGRFSGVSYPNAFMLFEIANCCCLLGLLYYFIRFTFFKKINLDRPSIFIISGSLISIVILLMLAYFTTTYKPQVSGFSVWFYNYDPRYFAFIYLFIQTFILLCFSSYKSSLRNFILKATIYLSLFFFTVEILHGIYYNVKIITKQNDVVSFKNRWDDYKQFPAMLKELTRKYPDREILITSTDRFFLNKASEMGYKSIFDYLSFNTAPPLVYKKSLLLFPIYEYDLGSMQDYLKNRQPHLLSKIAATEFYLDELNP